MKRLRRLFLRLLLLLALLFLGYQLWIFAQIVYWSRFDPASTAFMERRLAELRAKNPRAELKHQWVPYGRISAHLKRAIVAAEDARFLEHEGFDFEAIQKAYEKNLKKGRIVAGASTISQQLAKNLFLSPERTPWRKAQEALITVMLEAVMSKRRILEVYLNVVEFGRGVFGAEAAARYYFRTSAAKLAPNQAARLAVMLPNPRYYDRNRSTNYLIKRTSLIQRRMRAAELP